MTKEREDIFDFYGGLNPWDIMQEVEAKLKEKNT